MCKCIYMYITGTSDTMASKRTYVYICMHMYIHIYTYMYTYINVYICR